MKLILQAFLLCLVNSTTLISLLGMDHLLDGLAIKSPSTDPFGDPSIAYMLDPNINVFLMQFRNRTELCDYKCVSIYNLPCFLLFGCNIQIRNFILIFILPFIMLLAICICCAKRFWTFKCWLKYVAVFSGFNFFTWVVSRCKQGSNVRRRKLQRKQKQKELENHQNNYEIEPVPQSLERMGSKQPQN